MKKKNPYANISISPVTAPKKPAAGKVKAQKKVASGDLRAKGGK